jgi:hypothetical protein
LARFQIFDLGSVWETSRPNLRAPAISLSVFAPTGRFSCVGHFSTTTRHSREISPRPRLMAEIVAKRLVEHSLF